MNDVERLKIIKLDLDRLYFQLKTLNDCFDKYIKGCKSSDYDSRVRTLTGIAEKNLHIASSHQKMLISKKSEERNKNIKKNRIKIKHCKNVK